MDYLDEYINPHNFRHTRARFASKQSPQYLNATRQALGQKNIDTTLTSYGELSVYEQRQVMVGLRFLKVGKMGLEVDISEPCAFA